MPTNAPRAPRAPEPSPDPIDDAVGTADADADADTDADAGSDAHLAHAIAQGDFDAFERLMRRHNRRLFRLARASLRDDAEAEDALQEAYLQAYRAIGEFRGEASLATWLSRLVLNQCLGRRRRQARRDNVVAIVPADTIPDLEHRLMSPDDERPDQALARAQLRALLERPIDVLPASFRVVFVMREVEELGVEETARALDLPEATVRSRHFRARALLREALARDLDLAARDVFSFDGARCDRIVDRVLSTARGRRGEPDPRP
jgi:RNA polymerase sigma-70 factor (ECF subfamily)